jgi:hypothetical protein
MKTAIRISGVLAVLSLSMAMALSAAEEQVGGPKGGRLLENEAPRAEFFVEKDRAVTITFYDKALKPVPPGDQVVTAIAETKAGKAKLEFEKKAGVLVSRTPLPEGDGYTVVVQIKAKPDAKPQNFRIKYDTSLCAKCKRAEYACTCHE